MRSSSILSNKIKLYLIGIVIVNMRSLISQVEAQVISHELRRLAVSTNQFGIDALKALDRIEPPDKIIVFSPICLSSSLMMIMMGSSKYQIVTSFKQALYVWSLKPAEINRAFKDLFEHIGLNQQQTYSGKSNSIIPPTGASNSFQKRSFAADNELTSLNDHLQTESSNNFRQDYISLPKMMKIKELVERSSSDMTDPWWKLLRKGHHNNSSRHLRQTVQYLDGKSTELKRQVSEIIQDKHQESSNITSGERSNRETSDVSQMNAISNIYIQRGLNMNYNYNLLLKEYYKTVIHPVDFFHNAEETRQHINSLVFTNTEGKIKDLVKKSTFENVTQPKIMIISTFHLRATLDVQVKNQQTTTTTDQQSSNEIRVSPNKPLKSKEKVFIRTDESLLKFGLFNNLDCSVIEIPFNNRLVSLIIVMPNNHNSTELLITRLSAQVLSDMVNSLIVKKISVEIPIIKFDRGPVNVEGLLKELGLGQYFFGGRIHTTETGLNKWMRPSDIVHETSIDIGTINPQFPQVEDRLKVGAHDDTQVQPSATVLPSIKPNNTKVKSKKGFSVDKLDHIKLDKPFLYFVLDSINGLILTMGRIRQ